MSLSTRMTLLTCVALTAAFAAGSSTAHAGLILESLSLPQQLLQPEQIGAIPQANGYGNLQTQDGDWNYGALTDANDPAGGTVNGGGGGGSLGGLSGGAAGGLSSGTSSPSLGGAGAGGGGGGGAPAGSTVSNPLLPVGGNTSTPPYTFQYNVTPGGPGNTTPLFVDPDVATGFQFDIISGPLFGSVGIPNPLPVTGQDTFTLSYGDQTTTLNAGTPFTFPGGGVPQFIISGIDPAEGLDPNNHPTFVSQVTFDGTGESVFTMTPIIHHNPEPSTFALMGLGLVGLAGWYRRGRMAA